jgi:hypothetical protein
LLWRTWQPDLEPQLLREIYIFDTGLLANDQIEDSTYNCARDLVSKDRATISLGGKQAHSNEILTVRINGPVWLDQYTLKGEQARDLDIFCLRYCCAE